MRLLDISLPVVVCSVEVAVVGVSVKHKRDDHVSNFYILQQINGFQGINESEFSMVTKKRLLLASLTMVLFVGFFVYQIVVDSFLPGVVCCVEVAVVGVSVKSKGDDHVSNICIFLTEIQIPRNY